MKPKHPEQKPLTQETLPPIAKNIFEQLTEGQQHGKDAISRIQNNAALAVASVADYFIEHEPNKWLFNQDHLYEAIQEAYRIALVSYDDPLKDLSSCIHAYLECRLRGGNDALIEFKAMQFFNANNEKMYGAHLVYKAELTGIKLYAPKPKEPRTSWAELRKEEDPPMTWEQYVETAVQEYDAAKRNAEHAAQKTAAEENNDILPLEDHEHLRGKKKTGGSPGELGS